MILQINQSELLTSLSLSPSRPCYTRDLLFLFSFNIEADDEGLDPEIELEMEAFIEEIEEHLMMRDFDPELDHSQQ